MAEVDNFGLSEFTEKELSFFKFLPDNLISIIDYHRGVDISSLKNCYIYTGRGPSKSNFHIGHLPALKLCLELQKHFQERIEFMISDDEKIFRDRIDSSIMRKNVETTIQQLKFIGFNSSNTNFRINSMGISEEEYKLLIEMMSIVNIKTLDCLFGKKENIGEYFYPLLQILPSLSKTKKCLIIAGVDQDPFFRLARDIARKLKFNLPMIIYTKSVPGLDGSEKMSTSLLSSNPIYLGDKEEEIINKVKKIKIVGASSLDELFEKGSNLLVDIPFRLIEIFDSNIQNVNLIRKSYTVGITEEAEIAELKSIIIDKGIIERNGKFMITTFGVRDYLSKILIEICKLEN